MYRFVMSAIAVLFICSVSYSQNKPTIGVKVIDTDTVFVFNKPYASYIVSKFDSLRHYKVSYFDCVATLDSAASVIQGYKNIVAENDDLILNLNKQVMHCDELSELHYKSEQLNNQLQKDLKKQYRKTKIWSSVGWAAISTTLLTSIFFIIK